MLLEFRLFLELHCWHTQTVTLSLSYVDPSLGQREEKQVILHCQSQGSFMVIKAMGSHSPLFGDIPLADPIGPVVKNKILLFS